MNADRCAICGAAAPLHPVHRPRTHDDGRDPNDVVYLCANCHRQFDQGALRAFEFEVVLAKLMHANAEFVDVRMEVPVHVADGSISSADIVAKTSDRTQTVVVECKSMQTIGLARLRKGIEELNRYRNDDDPARRLVFALPARLTDEQKAVAESAGVEVWDLDVLARMFRHQLGGIAHPLLGPLLVAAAALSQPGPQSAEAELLQELRALEPGREVSEIPCKGRHQVTPAAFLENRSRVG